MQHLIAFWKLSGEQCCSFATVRTPQDGCWTYCMCASLIYHKARVHESQLCSTRQAKVQVGEGAGTYQRWMKEQSMRMRTRACTKAYTTSRLYSTLVLNRKVSEPSMPATFFCFFLCHIMIMTNLRRPKVLAELHTLPHSVQTVCAMLLQCEALMLPWSTQAWQLSACASKHVDSHSHLCDKDPMYSVQDASAGIEYCLNSLHHCLQYMQGVIHCEFLSPNTEG